MTRALTVEQASHGIDRVTLARADDLRARLSELRASGAALVARCHGEFGPMAVIAKLEPELRTHCGCGARPVCVHGAALLMSWALTPDKFASESEDAVIDRLEKLVHRALSEGHGEHRDRTAVEFSMVAEQLWGVHHAALSARVSVLARRLAYRKLAPSGVSFARGMADLHRQVRRLRVTPEPPAVRAPSPVSLVEYSFEDGMESDESVVRESRCVDLVSGRHLCVRQVVPLLSSDASEIVAREGRGEGVGQVVAGYPPQAISWVGGVQLSAWDAATAERLLAVCLPGVSAAVDAYQKVVADPFAPDAVPVAVRVDGIVAHYDRIAVATGTDGVLVSQRTAGEVRAQALGAQLLAVIGEVTVEAALVVLDARALITAAEGDVRLVRLRRSAAESNTDAVDRWGTLAKAVGVRQAALALGALRAQVADAAASGVTQAPADKWAATLTRFGLKKAAEIAATLHTCADPVDRWVELLRVVEHALVRASAVVSVSPEAAIATLGEVRPAVYVPVSFALSVNEVASRFDLWADGRERDAIVARLSDAPELARAAAQSAVRHWRGRAVVDTAVAVLARVGGVATPEDWPTEPLVARKNAELLLASRAGLADAREREISLLDHIATIRDARRFPSSRAAAVRALGELGDRRAIPCLRQIWRDGRADELIETSVIALASLGDATILPWIEAEMEQGQRRVAVEAAGRLGDIRLAPMVIAAWSSRADELAQRAIAGFGLTVLPHLIRAAADAPRPERFGVFDDLPVDAVVAAATAELAAKARDATSVSGMLEVLARVSPDAHLEAANAITGTPIAADPAVRRALRPRPKPQVVVEAPPPPPVAPPPVKVPPDRLAAPELRFGVWFPAGTRVEVADGAWVAVELVAPLSVRGVTWPKGSIFGVSGHDIVAVEVPLQATPLQVGADAALAGRWRVVDSGWQLAWLRLPRPQRFGASRFERDDIVEFDGGRPIAVTLGCKRVIDGVARDAGSRLPLE